MDYGETYVSTRSATVAVIVCSTMPKPNLLSDVASFLSSALWRRTFWILGGLWTIFGVFARILGTLDTTARTNWNLVAIAGRLSAEDFALGVALVCLVALAAGSYDIFQAQRSELAALRVTTRQSEAHSDFGDLDTHRQQGKPIVTVGELLGNEQDGSGFKVQNTGDATAYAVQITPIGDYAFQQCDALPPGRTELIRFQGSYAGGFGAYSLKSNLGRKRAVVKIPMALEYRDGTGNRFRIPGDLVINDRKTCHVELGDSILPIDSESTHSGKTLS